MPQPRRLVFANSLDYARLTGGFVYNTRLMRELAALDWDVTSLDLPAGFPRPDAEARTRTAELLAALPADTIVIADQICLSPVAREIAREAQRLRLVMIFHHPIAMEEGLSPDDRARFAEAERKALAACRRVIASSHTTAATLSADYGVPSSRIVVAVPGMERPAVVTPAPVAGVPRLLSVGAIIPRKGYHVLIEALAGLTHLPWTLGIVGDLERAPDHVAELHTMIGAAGLEGRIRLEGGLSEADLEAQWQSTQVFVAASLHEGYGMAVAEAIARGVPVVTTGAGAVEGWLDPSAALIVPERSPEALRAALARVLTQPALCAELREAALRAASRFPSWADAAAVVDGPLGAL